MARKFKNFIESVYGKQVKGRWKKLVISIVILITTIGVTVFMITNLGYSKKQGFFIKPWNVKVNINKEDKK